jgi:hypothetical protein
MSADFGDPTESHLFQVFQDKASADFIIHYGKQKIKAHKSILYGSSEHFRAMLGQKWKESSFCNIEPPGNASLKAFERFLLFLYTREIEINDLNLTDLYKLADYFIEPELKNLISDKIIELLDSNNILDYVDLFQSTTDEAIKKSFVEIVEKEFDKLRQQAQFPFEIFCKESSLYKDKFNVVRKEQKVGHTLRPLYRTNKVNNQIKNHESNHRFILILNKTDLNEIVISSY